MVADPFEAAGDEQQLRGAADRCWVMAAFPNEDWAKRLGATLYAQLGLTDKARVLADKALQGQATAFDYFTHSRTRDPSDTVGQLADLGQALRLDPKFVPALMARAQTYYAADRYDEALADTAELLKLNPKLSEVYLLRANLFRRLGRKEDALGQAKAVVAANPDEAWSHAAAGRIYGAFDMHKEALAELDQAVKMDPAFYVDRSYVHERTDWDGRLADVEQALQHDPNNTDTLYAKAEILKEKGDYAGAVQVYTKLLDKGPVTAGALNARGIALSRAGRGVEAETDFAKARQMATDAETLNNICYSKAVAAVALERALEECNAALRLLPDAARILDSRGTVLLQMGKLDEAIADFNKALAKAPTLTPTRYARAVAWARKGDMMKAKADEQAALKLDPSIAERFAGYGLTIQSQTKAPVNQTASAR
jgi:tetratricopeptide (TPR) repeat protein